MKHMREFSDRRQKSWCIHCTRYLSGVQTSADHVPTKSLLSTPRPDNLPVVTICRDCNTGFSLDEQYAVAFLGAVLSGSTDPEAQTLESAKDAFAHSPSLRKLIDACRNDYPGMDGQTRALWTPDHSRIERVVVKNARGHAYFEFGEPMMQPPSTVWFMPIEHMAPTEMDAFERLASEDIAAGWAEVGSRMLTRMTEGQDLVDGWVTVQPGRYKYAVEQVRGLRVRSIWSEYLAVWSRNEVVRIDFED